LRTSLEDARLASSGFLVSLGGAEPVHFDDAVAALDDVAKPVRCTAKAVDDVLQIDCRQITEPLVLSIQQERGDRLAQSWSHQLRTKYRANEDDPLLLVRILNQSLPVPLSVFERFFRDYRIYCAVTLNPPDEEASDRGARGVVGIHRSGRATMVGTFPDITWHFH